MIEFVGVCPPMIIVHYFLTTPADPFLKFFKAYFGRTSQANNTQKIHYIIFFFVCIDYTLFFYKNGVNPFHHGYS